jgi:hypothetical protein
MKKILLIVGFLILAGFASYKYAYGQGPNPVPLQLTLSGVHTQCVPNAATTPAHLDVCGAGDGIFLANNGGAFVQVATVTVTAQGVTQITICNAAGASCGAAQTGAVSINIPKSVVVTAPATTTVTPTATLQ